MSRRDFKLLALLAVPPLLLFGLRWLMGQSYFWGDLTYIHFGWRASAADMIQRGVLPLWNPYAYLGMPLAAQMQGGAWYPGTLPFYLFGFSSALPIFHVLHFWLAGAFTFLWLRRLKMGRSAAFAGALVAMLCGGMASRIPFLNHVSTIALIPAFLLLASRPVLLGCAFALSFLSGYPTMLAGAGLAALLLDAGLTWTRKTAPQRVLGWLTATGLSLLLGACLLLPAMELAKGSRRGSGVPVAEAVTWSFAPKDLRQLTAPPLIPKEEFRSDTLWWKTTYFGWLACAAIMVGLLRCSPVAAAGILSYLFAVLLLLLGGSNAVSGWMWSELWPLKFVRYPGNMAYLLIPVAALLVARGLDRRRWAPWVVLVLGAELFLYAWSGQPVVPHEHYTSPGPLVPTVRREAGDHRYLMSPLALQWHRGLGPTAASASMDLKHRLYGVTNMPYRLYSVGNFGEPLVPRANYDMMDYLYSRHNLYEVEQWFPWLDVRILMTREAQPPGAMTDAGHVLWQLYRNQRDVGRAYVLPDEVGASLSAVRPRYPPRFINIAPAEFSRAREDRYSVRGEGGDWLYVAEPRWPGWSVHVNGLPVEHEPALGAFLKVRTPPGPWLAQFRYYPNSWRIGSSITLLVLCALAAYWYNRLRRYAAS
jgi:hypothetical protein